jgi:hypothetical protein
MSRYCRFFILLVLVIRQGVLMGMERGSVDYIVVLLFSLDSPLRLRFASILLIRKYVYPKKKYLYRFLKYICLSSYYLQIPRSISSGSPHE